jgi:hypothetical protein
MVAATDRPSRRRRPTFSGRRMRCNTASSTMTLVVITSSPQTAIYAAPSGSFTATYQEEAVADTARGGLLDFILQVTNSSTSTDQVGRATSASFTGFTTDVGFLTAGSTTGTLTGGTVAPTTVGERHRFRFRWLSGRSDVEHLDG